MTDADAYRKLAAELKVKAEQEPSARLASEWDHLANCYLRLALQAKRNSFHDLSVEIGPRPSLGGDGP